jgi:class 3 adenylate cyclase
VGHRSDDANSKAGRRRVPAKFPEGVLTFLLTDIEGSTLLWERHRAVMGAALARHEALVAEAVASHGGQLIKARGEGDSTLSVFVRASQAVAAAVALQRTLATEDFPGGIALPTRAALHTGEAELRDGDFYGQTLNQAARLRALGRGGQPPVSLRVNRAAQPSRRRRPYPANRAAAQPAWRQEQASARPCARGTPTGATTR